MANIPGISGYIQPGVFARDRVVSRGVSIPGGIRVLSILGEGSKEQVLVESALGLGQDGVASPDGEVNGRFFKLSDYPVVSGRTSLYLNNSLLFGKQEKISGTLDSKYDYRIDISSGYIELKGASLKDFGGKSYSASSSNVGLGQIKKIILLDPDMSAEKYTVRCATVVRGPSGEPIPGRSKFSVSGNTSGVSRDANGNQVMFTDTYKVAEDFTLYRNNDITGGLTIASTLEAGLFPVAFTSAQAVLVDGSGTSRQALTSGSTVYVEISDNHGSDGTQGGNDDLSLADKIIVGDSFIVNGQEYVVEVVKDLASSVVLTLSKPIGFNEGNDVTNEAITSWEVKCFDAAKSSTISLSSSDVGKFFRIESGSMEGDYVVTAVQSSDGIIRFEPYYSATSMPSITSDVLSQTIELLETNGSVAIGIEQHQTVGFYVGDKFTFEIESNALSQGDNLKAVYIYSLDVNDPEFFISSVDLTNKHGVPSLDNNLSLGAQMAFENGAPGVLAVQTKPALPRRTSVTLIPEVNSLGQGGYSGPTGSAAAPDEDDLTFSIPTPVAEGIRAGKPDAGSSISLFVVRDQKEIQLFPNKETFYNPQYDDAIGRQSFVDSADLAYSYTIVNYDAEIIASSVSGLLSPDEADSTKAFFFAADINFDSSSIGKVIVIRSGERSDTSAVESDADAIGSFLFAANKTHMLEITSVVDDNTVKVSNSKSSTQAFNNVGMSDIQVILKDSGSSSQTAALVLNRDLVRSGAIKSGDGIKISYVDENDAGFFDANFFEALEKLEAFEAQIIVPLPKETKSAVFQATVRHCELMSSVPKKRERLALIGAMQGITPDALIGRTLVAVENVGVIEGIQGDDPEEILSQNIEDLQNFKLNENYTSNRCVYFYPDQIVRNISGTNTYLDGFYVAAAAGGLLSATQNVAVPLTYKVLTGFTILRDRVFRDVTLNELGNVGATVLQPVAGGGKVLAGRTTSISGYIEDEEISIIFIRDRVKSVLRDSLQGYIGGVQDSNTITAILVRVKSILSALEAQQVIESSTNVRVERDKVDPRQVNVYLRFVPVFPVNHIFIDIEVGL